MDVSAQDFEIDDADGRITFAVRWLGAITVTGRLTGLTGRIRVPDGCMERTEIELAVAADSVNTGIALRDRHLRGPRFLDVLAHPLIQFKSSTVRPERSSIAVEGILSLRGRERQIAFLCRVGDEAANGSNGAGPLVRVTGSFTVPRLEYGVGVARGLHRLNPAMYAIGTDVIVDVALLVPVRLMGPARPPVLAR